MRKIKVFYDNSLYTLRWLRGLVNCMQEFKEYGYNIEFDTCSAPLPKMNTILPLPTQKGKWFKLFSKKEEDIVFLAYHHSCGGGLCQIAPADRAEVLSYLRKHCAKIVWMDTADGTGNCMFDVMPYVDLYLKKQILKNKKRYCEPIWSQRIFGEYYHDFFGISETGQCEDAGYSCLDEKYIDKIGISWNVGLGDLFTTGSKRWIYRSKVAPVDFVMPSLNVKYDVHYRGRMYPGAIGYQRIYTRELLDKRTDILMPDINTAVPYKRYIKEAKDSLSLISPFGWGEICGRDFEAFVFGCTLIKYNMEHLVTYPNCYIADETYISINWDFSNFNHILDDLKTDIGRKKAIEIAVNGQKMYKEYLTDKEKKKEFVEHIISQIS